MARRRERLAPPPSSLAAFSFITMTQSDYNRLVALYVKVFQLKDLSPDEEQELSDLTRKAQPGTNHAAQLEAQAQVKK